MISRRDGSGSPSLAAMRSRDSRIGAATAMAAFVAWGFFPFYFKALADVATVEVVAHRIVWALPTLVLFLLLGTRPHELRQVLASWRMVLGLLASSLLILVNWLIYVLAVSSAHVLDASLGYFLGPLVAVALGMALFGERLNLWRGIAVACALAGIAQLIWHYGRLPLIAIAIAVTFSLYGALRKRLPVGPVVGQLVECLLLAPVAVAALVVLDLQDRLAFLHRGAGTDLMLLAAGPLTVLPLVLYATAAKRLDFATLGMLNYATPTILFLEGVIWFGEPAEPARLLAFAGIWLGLAIYTVDGFARRRG